VTATPKGNGLPERARDAAAFYLDRGRLPVPVRFQGKEPWDHAVNRLREGWEALRPGREDLDRLFPASTASNLGLLTGAPSGGLLDIDLDAAEAVTAAPYFLPTTGWVSGRQGRPCSHYWYVVGDPPAKASDEYRDLDRSMLLEVRSSGGQTVAPPGVHESGEAILWDTFTEPAAVDFKELRAAARALAAATLLARHWPRKGSRDEAAMALAGGLARCGWPAEDVSLFCRAVGVAAGDEESHARGKKARPTARKQEEGKPTTGWPRLAELLRGDGAAVVSRVKEWVGITLAFGGAGPASAVPPDIGLPLESPWPAPLAEEAFHGLAGEAVRVLEPVSESDPAALLLQLLVGFGSVVGSGPHFEVEEDRHGANEYLVLVGTTSKARKGSSWGRARKLLAATDPAWADERVQGGLSSGEGVVWAVRDRIVKRERCRENGPARYEEVEADPGVLDKRLLAFEPEFANVLKVSQRQGNTLSTVIRQAWDSGNLRTMTKNSPARSTGAHISIVGHITADELRRYLSETETANGFGNRFMFACVKRSKALPEGGNPDPQALADVQSRLAAAVVFARQAGVMGRDDEARELWGATYGELSDGRPGLTGALLGRAEAHVLRLALVYALLDRARAIAPPHLLAALAVWQFIEESVLHVFGDALGDPVADDLLRLLRACPDGLTRTDISAYLGRNLSADRIGRALGMLLQYGLAYRDQQQTGGRPSERWRATDRRRRG
jgi:hypothetical protein